MSRGTDSGSVIAMRPVTARSIRPPYPYCSIFHLHIRNHLTSSGGKNRHSGRRGGKNRFDAGADRTPARHEIVDENDMPSPNAVFLFYLKGAQHVTIPLGLPEAGLAPGMPAPYQYSVFIGQVQTLRHSYGEERGLIVPPPAPPATV